MPKHDQKLYFISLIPPSPLRDEIQKLKYYVRDKYNSSRSLNAPPHITLLAPFKLSGAKEELSDMLDRFSSKWRSFKISFNHFSVFSPRVIFIDVEKSKELLQIQKHLENMARSNPDIFSYNYDEREYHPHLTLAFRDLSKADFYKAWDEFKHKKFEADFLTEKMSLLKHNGEQWKVVEEFDFSRIEFAENPQNKGHH
ncbi:MAG: 2'-5' RNA ligase family protein [Balneolaceae bacterium]